MPATFRIEPSNLQALITELRSVDKELVNEFRREFRSELKPFGDRLASNVPSAPPISGFGKLGQSPYIYRKPTVKIDTTFRKKSRRNQVPVVSIRFNDRRPNAGFSILETAGTRNIGKDKGGMTHRGVNMVTGLASKGFSVGKGGRWVIPQFYSRQPEITEVAKKILVKFAGKVNLRLREKGGK